MKLRYAALISLLIHLSVLVGVIPIESAKNNTKNDNTTQVDVIPAQNPNTTAGDTKGPSVKKKRFKSKTQCLHDSWYGGIGIQEDNSLKIIDVVYPGYPADKAGLKAGDNITLTDGEIRGEPGTTLSMAIFRPSTNESLLFNIIRDRICYGQRKETKTSP